MITEKAQKILNKMKEKDRQAMKKFHPYKGPPDLEFIGMHGSMPKTQRQEGGDG